MNQITQFFSNLKADFDRLNQSVDELVKTYNAILHFLDLISNLFPIDLVLVLGLSIPILYLINTLSPSSPRVNYTISILFVSGIRSFLTHAISDTWDLFRVSKTAVLLLLPAYGFLLLKLILAWIRKIRIRNRALSPKNLESSFRSLQNAYHGLSAQIYSNLEDKTEKDFLDGEKFLARIQDLEESILGLKKLLSEKKNMPETKPNEAKENFEI
ncbi:hypothetical protein [Leptospira wolffii]|uniref:hypothetical protein n=1 Tax=Leptospira wolffii TaxID=409998 RepID=UPI000307BDFF|nr:hypothetical protein [Leptospira wolffii]EPG65245.1 hypothetical protein LEP1GSC061_2922 [Leptospira wolffii serovar Khorat str. Khorat-H2]